MTRSKSVSNIKSYNHKRLKNNLIKLSDEITKQKRIKTLTDFLEIKDEIIDFEEIVEIKINNVSLSQLTKVQTEHLINVLQRHKSSINLGQIPCSKP